MAYENTKYNGHQLLCIYSIGVEIARLLTRVQSTSEMAYLTEYFSFVIVSRGLHLCQIPKSTCWKEMAMQLLVRSNTCARPGAAHGVPIM